MDTSKNFIIAKGRIITADVISVRYVENERCNVTMKNGKVYTYNNSNLVWLKDPKSVDVSNTYIFRNGQKLNNIESAIVFNHGSKQYWHVFYANGHECSYLDSEIQIISNCLADKKSNNVFNYLKQVTECAELKGDDGTNLLSKQYEKLSFVESNCALAAYLNPGNYKPKVSPYPNPIFPFGCNSSQFTAVKNALENQISIIQGPPGTGKTQTILNIIANILIQGKTVQVVSNNNSATANVLEKLSSEKYGLGFIVAPLGNSQNKKDFVASQTGIYPDISSWKCEGAESPEFTNELSSLSSELSSAFSTQESLARAKRELGAIKLEQQYFENYFDITVNKDEYVTLNKKLGSSQLMRFLQECRDISDSQKELSFFFKLKSFFVYGIHNFSFYKQDISIIINTVQKLFYESKIEELENEIKDLSENLEKHNFKQLIEDFSELSMCKLKNFLFNKYGNNSCRKIFLEEDLYKKYSAVQDEYPVILSTTFSSRSSLCKEATFDYLIIDEASQVDIATGALALSCAKNVVIVGDAKQLPNVVPPKIAKITDALWDSAKISSGYNFSKNSLLQSVCDLLPGVPQTLLREHYRCHPKIIDFCNQKFYNGELVIMSEDNGESDVLSAIKTVKGNHAHNHSNQRQIDVINNEILSEIDTKNKDIGIISPYNAQVSAVKSSVPKDIDVATVHKFQGREKDVIIITTVDNEISDFVDDPYLLNVAISRAKKKLYLVVSGNDQSNSNISDLISYIEYNNFSVTESKIFSIFDYLYQQYTESRKEFLKKRKRVSEYDSENLMFAVIEDVLNELNLQHLKTACHYPLNLLISDPSLLTEKEIRYAMNSATHVDFLIYNGIRKSPVLAIEVDGYSFHQNNPEQLARDAMKNHILEQYNIPYLRISTNGSGEKEKLLNKLNEVL